MYQLTRGAELVDRSCADAEALGYLAHRQQLLGKLHGSRGHGGDKSSLVWRGIDSIRCIGSLGARNDVERSWASGSHLPIRTRARLLRAISMNRKQELHARIVLGPKTEDSDAVTTDMLLKCAMQRRIYRAQTYREPLLPEDFLTVMERQRSNSPG